MKNLSLRSEIKRKSYLKIYSLFEYLLFDHFATMGAERRLGALPRATRSGRPQWMPTHARAVIMVSSFWFLVRYVCKDTNIYVYLQVFCDFG